MTGPYKPGLYRIFYKSGSVRFFRVNKSTSGDWTIREYRNGDLHDFIVGSRKRLTSKSWEKLEFWQ